MTLEQLKKNPQKKVEKEREKTKKPGRIESK